MKTPDEIKKGLKCCSEDGCKGCNYVDDCNMADGFSVLAYDALAYIQQLEDHIRDLAKMVPKWISVEERLPSEFVSVLAHMTDAGEFPAVREAYSVCGRFFFPALMENHPVDYWAEIPEPLTCV